VNLLSAPQVQRDDVVLAARLDAELDKALALLERGCPPALALRILA
jgi:hypothetical protein